jgi:hypothetical protein
VAVPADGDTTQKEAEKIKLNEFMGRDASNKGHEMFDFTGNNWSHRKG